MLQLLAMISLSSSVSRALRVLSQLRRLPVRAFETCPQLNVACAWLSKERSTICGFSARPLAPTSQEDGAPCPVALPKMFNPLGGIPNTDVSTLNC